MIDPTTVAVVAVFVGILSLADAIFVRKRILLTLQRIINAGLFFWIASQFGLQMPIDPLHGMVSLSRKILLVLCLLHGFEIISRWNMEYLGKIYQKIRSKLKHE